MKYYAVTEDPNELMHFGIKGMKWGVIRTPEQLGHYQKPKMPRGMKAPKQTKPRSPAYMRASAKLSQKMRHGIAAAQANWAKANAPEQKAMRAQRKREKAFEKHVELARKGRLKYKGISDDEVMRITDRLALERQSRSLSGTEKPSFRSRLAESIGNGIVQGVGQGVSVAVGERIGRKSKLKTSRLMQEQSSRMATARARAEEHYQDKRAKKKAEEAKNDEFRELANIYGDQLQYVDRNGNTRNYSSSTLNAYGLQSRASRDKLLNQLRGLQDDDTYRVKRERELAEITNPTEQYYRNQKNFMDNYYRKLAEEAAKNNDTGDFIDSYVPAFNPYSHSIPKPIKGNKDNEKSKNKVATVGDVENLINKANNVSRKSNKQKDQEERLNRQNRVSFNRRSSSPKPDIKVDPVYVVDPDGNITFDWRETRQRYSTDRRRKRRK